MNMTDVITKSTISGDVDLEILPQFVGRTGSLFAESYQYVVCLKKLPHFYNLPQVFMAQKYYKVNLHGSKFNTALV